MGKPTFAGPRRPMELEDAPMRYQTAAALVVALTAIVSTQGSAVAGRWQAELAGPGGTTVTETLDLVVKGESVEGTFTNAVGGTDRIRDGKWDGATLRFWVPWDPGRLEAVGRMAGAALEVDLKTSRWSATRVFKRLPAPKGR